MHAKRNAKKQREVKKKCKKNNLGSEGNPGLQMCDVKKKCSSSSEGNTDARRSTEETTSPISLTTRSPPVTNTATV